ncbi:ABC transporter ATP-binding protein [Candidatus Roizmanbacteria bacterium]|nr:ABC transporter ATP-binding protein [Candidatus Roizmanbacteria bacterium]
MKVIQAVKFVVIRTYKTTKILLVVYISLTIFISLLAFINILVFKEVIDAANGQETILGLSILSLFFLWFIYQIFEKALEKFAEYLWNIIDLKQTIYNTSDFVNKLSTLDLSNFENPQTYDKIWRSFNRIPWQLKYYLDSAIKLLGKSIELSISIFIFFVVSPLSAILIVFANIIPILVKSKIGEQTFNIYKADSETRRRFEYTSSLVTQRDTLIEIKQFHGFKFIKEKLLSIYNIFSKKQKGLFKRAWLNLTFVEMIPIFAAFIFLITIIIQLNNRIITTGTFVFLFTNILVFNGALWNLTYFLGTLISDSHFIHDAIDYYSIKRNIDFPKITPSLEKELLEKLKNPIITVENVSFHYPNAARMVLKNINLIIPSSQNIAIIGENGAGKTTLVKLLLRVYDPTEGKILLNGIDLKNVPENILFKTYSTLFQSFGKFYLTIRENMELGAGRKLPDDEYIKALKLSNAWHYINAFPKKLDQQLGPNYTDGVDLSGGQWQQLAIAKALVRKTPVLILDEPTSSVDAKAETEIFDRLNKETKDRTIIFISHRFSTIKDAHRIVVIHKGKIIEDGNHEELLKNKGQYATLYALQAERYLRAE